MQNLRFHHWGVVDGLGVAKHSDSEVIISPGFALDSFGRELIVDEAVILSIDEFGPNQTVYIALSFEEKLEENRAFEQAEGPARMAEFSIASAGTSQPTGGAVTLATVRLDGAARIVELSVSYEHANYASSILAPGVVGYREIADYSITQAKLGQGLRTGWVRMCFKPIPMENKKPFRIGPTEARSTDEGASGSMGIPAPPGVTDVIRFRIAGELNEGVISVGLYRCGWNEKNSDHEKTTLLEKNFAGANPPRSFEHTVELDPAVGRLDHQYHALAVVLEASKKASISLVAVEFGHPH